MAAGDIIIPDEAINWLGLEIYNLSTDTLKGMYIVDELSVVDSLAAPAYGEGATTDLSDSETSGGNATAGGIDITNTWSETGGVGTLDATDIDLEQNGSNPTDMRWLGVYTEEATNNNALFFVDLGTNIDGTAGDLAIVWNGSGIFTLAVA